MESFLDWYFLICVYSAGLYTSRLIYIEKKSGFSAFKAFLLSPFWPLILAKDIATLNKVKK